MPFRSLLQTVTSLIILLAVPLVVQSDEKAMTWKIKQLTVDANEGIDLADVDKDGKLDIIAGRNWYAAPDFTPRPLRAIKDWNGYVQSNGDFAYDVDADGWVDVISCDFLLTEVHWYRNPGIKGLKLGQMWEKRLLVDTKTSTNEGELFEDLDGDGKPEWIVNSWKQPTPQHIWRLTTEKRQVEVKKGRKKVEDIRTVPTMSKFVINKTGNGHGLGVGDINGDGLKDILCGTGWYECPSKKERYTKEWKYHADWEYLHSSVPMLVRDMDGDGRNDIIWGVGHGFGLYWWQQLKPDSDGKTNWKKHLIDDTFSQPHCLAWADLDGDGKDELITGKRVYAHNCKDPGGELPPSIFYYTWNKKKLKFEKHIIDKGLVGVGLQIRTGDLNGDGRIDIAVAGKSGTFILFNMAK